MLFRSRMIILETLLVALLMIGGGCPGGSGGSGGSGDQPPTPRDLPGR